MKDIDSYDITYRIWCNGKFDRNGSILNDKIYDEFKRKFEGYCFRVSWQIELLCYALVYIAIAGLLYYNQRSGPALGLLLFASIPTYATFFNFETRSMQDAMVFFRFVFGLIIGLTAFKLICVYTQRPLEIL